MCYSPYLLSQINVHNIANFLLFCAVFMYCMSQFANIVFVVADAE